MPGRLAVMGPAALGGLRHSDLTEHPQVTAGSRPGASADYSMWPSRRTGAAAVLRWASQFRNSSRTPLSIPRDTAPDDPSILLRFQPSLT